LHEVLLVHRDSQELEHADAGAVARAQEECDHVGERAIGGGGHVRVLEEESEKLADALGN
jgi:hypothetical protein